ncbi:flagellar biosynthesis repressor FlbT [Blastochloris sulfoviridis]|uniref:Flagellar biosynthesis repressor FlbT n=1 Tax=Blastochloris sulfoviridis TaxID=50712 RepID=A0A5M6I4R5_9HYPH|nr:flagellar biosynthesis repressor FlbT [Blastochloris sulfoviridis]KAA5602768.1 flagellar biosynthesis repressor FlbT [Blastochloris sulfoviridis]
MALKVELKPGERIIIGQSVVTNGDHRARLLIDGEAPILREKDIMTVSEADTPCKRIYLIVQLMYLTGNPQKQQELYLELVDEVVKAAPSTLPHVETISAHIAANAIYKALKETRALVAYETELMAQARAGTPAP